MAALRFELLAHGFLHGSVADYGLLRSADSSVIKARSGQDVLHGFGNISRALYEDGNIAGADAEGGLTRRVGRTHKPDAARRQDDSRLLMLHQSFSALDGRTRHAADCRRWQS